MVVGDVDEEDDKKEEKELESDESKKDDLLMKRGARYMILDLGGGTGDIVCHHMIGENEVEEIRAPTGGIVASLSSSAHVHHFNYI